MNVERIGRAQEYKKQQILDKIEYDNQKTEALRIEKERLFASRASIRREAEKQKQQILDTFEQMKKRGKLDREVLAQFGVGRHSIQEDPKEYENKDEDFETTRNEGLMG